MKSYLFSRVSYVQPNVVFDFYALAPTDWPKYPRPECSTVAINELPQITKDKHILVVGRCAGMDRKEALAITN
jgi:hypothetical protein